MLLQLSLKSIKILLNFFLLYLVATKLGNSRERDSFVLMYSLFLSFETLFLGPILEYTRVKISGLENSKLLIIKYSLCIFSFISCLLFTILFYNRYQFLNLLSTFFFKIPKLFGGSVLVILFLNFIMSVNINFLAIIINQRRKYNALDFMNISGLIIAVFVLLSGTITDDSFFVTIPFLVPNICTLVGAWILFLVVRLQNQPFNCDITYFKVHFLRVLPLYYTFFVGQIFVVVQNYFLSHGTNGSLSNVDYARKFSETGITLVTSVLLSYYVPVISDIIGTYDKQRRVIHFNKILFFSGLVLIISSIASVLGPFILDIIFGKTAISKQSLTHIHKLAILYGNQIYVSFNYTLLSYFTFFFLGPKFYGLISLGTQLFQLSILVATFPLIGIYSLPICFLVSHSVSVIYLIRTIEVSNIYFKIMSVRLIYLYIIYLLGSVLLFIYPIEFYFSLIYFSCFILLAITYFHIRIINLKQLLKNIQ